MDTHRVQHGGFIALLVLALAPAARTTDPNPDSALNHDSADTFRSMMSDATARMHAAMHVPFTGDADRDFARMMIAHHQGAIDMAVLPLPHRKGERLERLGPGSLPTPQPGGERLAPGPGEAPSARQPPPRHTPP